MAEQMEKLAAKNKASDQEKPYAREFDEIFDPIQGVIYEYEPEEQYTALSISLGVISDRMKALQEKLNSVPIPYTKTLSRFWK
jgi:hypothetical protein